MKREMFVNRHLGPDENQIKNSSKIGVKSIENLLMKQYKIQYV